MRVFRSGLVGLALVLIAQGLVPGGASAANQSVSIVNFGFQPTPLSSTVGDIVTWTNTTASTPHTVTRCDAGCPVGPGSGTDSGFGSTAIINGGGTYSHTFTAPGSYIYYCQVHGYAAMHAEVDVVSSPLLRAVSSPALPTQILVDGQIADSWGLNWVKIPAGGHTVSFTHVEGWTEPVPQTVTLTSGNTTTLTGSFIQRGELHVFTSPAVASQITLDGNPTDDWGMFTDVPTGAHTVCYGKVANFDPPACQNVTVNAGALTTTTGTFTSHPGAVGQSGVGLLRVVSSPAVSSQITIKPAAGTPYIADSWGLNWLELAPGSYTVSFSHVEGWTEPAPQTLSVTSGNTTVATGSFTQRGELHVFTSPPVAGTVVIDGTPRDDWGTFTDIPIGSHMVCFGLASGFANTPPCQTTTVNAGVETDVTGMYS
jgi:plastocyanin